MICFPNGKINLGLHVSGKREDGYHNIETLFYPISVHDALEAIPSDIPGIFLSGLPIAGSLEDNLCMKAYWLLKKDYGQLPAINIFLHKIIPSGSGLGGGSADGAFMILTLNKLFALNLSQAQLHAYALKLGSDCPYFILNKPAFASGRGEVLEQIDLDLSGYSFLLVFPAIHISTSWAFSQIRKVRQSPAIKETIARPVQYWKEGLINDFEEAVFLEYPELKKTKDKLYEAGALYASMTGSGSCIFGIFGKNQLPSIAFENNFSVFAVK